MLNQKVKEAEIELLRTQKITEFLVELGKGFAFVGRPYYSTEAAKLFPFGAFHMR